MRPFALAIGGRIESPANVVHDGAFPMGGRMELLANTWGIF